ncbi:hypothetical protein [Sphingomonas sp.]|uniref:hypothetical protein n=1 Tax=Sphingomonas sp. TaxID=28214 RepID=UPI001E0BA48E|nr:hypothetical protein [Sphingomonas sp.]MBX9796298.1 hypothetical protein [Sphingomonas sp.]
MSNDKLILLIASLVAIFAVTALVRWLGLGRGGAIADDAAARAEAEAAFVGFRAARAILGRDRQAALVEGADGSVAVLKCHGVHVAARRLPRAAIRETDEGWLAETGEARFGTVLVRR